MKTQISRDSFKSDKRYSGVYLQQGRMITDADWNEETEISRRRLDDALADVVTSGVPRENGLKLEAVANQPLRLGRGRVYAGGVGALVTSTLDDPEQLFDLRQQADLPLPDGVVPPAKDYRLYADVWERTVTSIEDADQLRDAAFHGADTAARTQTMAQLKWCSSTVNPEDPAVNPGMGDAKLTLTLRSQIAGLDPCDPCAREITVPPRVGNYLFRLEVHAVEGPPKNPTRVVLKWSSENGAEAHAVGTEPADFKGSDWIYEYFTTRTEKHLGVHLAGGITPLAGQLVEGFPNPAPDNFPFVRRWDGYCILNRQGNQWSLGDGRERGVDLSTGSANDADGHVEFGNNGVGAQLSTLTLDLSLSAQTSFVAGDYWLAPVRESVHEPGDVVLDDELPVGIRHSYLLLATISDTGALVVPDTHRQQRLDFPSLTTLAAKDVDYTTNCDSGLFDATHDTVKKALDRICGINATHVGFTVPCPDKSIYKGANPANIKTVADALALLCDVRADQISYDNDDACQVLSGAKTVQEALHLLCMHESAGGCRTTIGLGGDYPTLKEAVADFLARGESNLCFCLLPGEHFVDEQIDLTQEPGRLSHFSLEGCGPASRLVLKMGISIEGYVSVRLNDLEIEISDVATLRVGGGEEVVIEGCRITTKQHDANPPVIVGASRLLRLDGNDVQATRLSELKVGRDITTDPALKAFFSESVAEKDLATEAGKAAAAIAGKTAAQRRKLSTDFEKAIQEREAATAPADRRIGSRQAESLRSLAKMIPSGSQTLANTLQRELLLLRGALLSAVADLAIVILPEGGHVDVTGNRIVGELSLYGKPGEVELTEDQLQILRRNMATGAVTLDSRDESLLLERNQIGRLRVSGELIIQLRDIGQNGQVTGLFRTVRLTDNVFTLDGHDLVCIEANLSGNRFVGARSRFATVIGRTVFYLTNHGPHDDRFMLMNVSLHTNTSSRHELNSIIIHDVV